MIEILQTADQPTTAMIEGFCVRPYAYPMCPSKRDNSAHQVMQVVSQNSSISCVHDLGNASERDSKIVLVLFQQAVECMSKLTYNTAN